MSHDTALQTFGLEAGVSLAHATPWQTAAVTSDSPALLVMTDLTQVKAASTSPTTSLRQAEQMMIYQGVRMLVVVTDMPSIEGLITTTDLHGERQMLLVVQRATDPAPRQVRGVISRAQIERQLGEAITITPIASSFAEIERALS